jgi:hypothetical protein
MCLSFFNLWVHIADLKVMFEPRPLLEYKVPLQQNKELPPYTGVAQYLNCFETTPPPVPPVFVPPHEQKQSLKEKLKAVHDEQNEFLATSWNPTENPKATE